MKFITTSWDDGHPQDFRLAELLDKYKIQGTFYIPRSNLEQPVMTEDKIKELSERFEIGGHTLNHLRLAKSQHESYEYEIKGSFDWLTALVGRAPVSFCFPGGVFDERVIKYVKASGYKLYRTTELLTIENNSDGLLSTTIQLYEHSRFTYIKHLLKRRRVENLIQWMSANSEKNLSAMIDQYIKLIDKKGSGCLHLWGHSWEIDKYGLWSKLEQILSRLSNESGFLFIQNKDLLPINRIS